MGNLMILNDCVCVCVCVHSFYQTNLCVVAHGSSFLRASTPDCPVQELLPEQSSLAVLWDTTEQRPAGTPLSPPEDRVIKNKFILHRIQP